MLIKVIAIKIAINKGNNEFVEFMESFVLWSILLFHRICCIFPFIYLNWVYFSNINCKSGMSNNCQVNEKYNLL